MPMEPLLLYLQIFALKSQAECIICLVLSKLEMNYYISYLTFPLAPLILVQILSVKAVSS